MATLFGYDDVFLMHDTGEHPECPSRLSAILAALEQEDFFQNLQPVTRRVDPTDWIRKNHSDTYIDRLKKACLNNERYIDTPDSAISSNSYNVACRAVALGLAACDMIMSRQSDNGFCALRPPGHHAEYDKSMGFCLFNNIAIACRYLQQKHGLKRILILDWDVHHGNGTQHSFERSNSVFYCSLHQHHASLYPGTGRPNEIGLNAGRGYTMNLALAPGAGDDDCLEMFSRIFMPKAKEFAPDFVLISAGFDGHRNDPLAGLNLTEKSYNQMTNQIKNLAENCCNGRLLSFLEGGYDLETLGSCVAGHIRKLLHNKKAQGTRHKA